MGNGKREMGQSDYRNNNYIGMMMAASTGRWDGVQGRSIYVTFTSPLRASLSIILYLANSSVLQTQTHNWTCQATSSPPDCQLDAGKTGCGYPLLSSMACCTIPSCLDRHANRVMGMNTIEREENCGRGAFDLGMSSHDFVCASSDLRISELLNFTRLDCSFTAPAGVVITSSRLAQHWLLGHIGGGSRAEFFGP